MEGHKFILRLGVTVTVLTLVFLVLPDRASAHEVDFFPTGYWGPLVACQEKEGGICTDLCDTFDLVSHLINFGLTILLFIIAPVLIAAGGLMILVSRGNEELLGRGKKILTGTVIGVAMGLGAFVIVATFLWLIGNNLDEPGKARVSWPKIECTAPPFQMLPQPEPVAGEDGECAECQGIADTFAGGRFVFTSPGSYKAATPMAEALSCVGRKFASNYMILVQPVRITEAWPPSSPHDDPKHSNGCAVDITPPENFRDSCSAWENLIDAAESCGLYALNENPACGGQATGLSTGPHVHLESSEGVCNN